jgi:phosphopantothenate---cysteine ligase (CTP)
VKRKVLITAGSTIVPIDQVRLISNIFHGRTGTEIAKYFAEQGDKVTLITSSPQLLKDYKEAPISIVTYRTYDQLKRAMEMAIFTEHFDMLIHSSAVSDYKIDGIFSEEYGQLRELDAKKKVSSRHEILYLRMSQTKKLVDLVKCEWMFFGKLVKFKLEVGKTDEELIEISKKSRADSRADLIVANCLEWMGLKAFIIDENDTVQKVVRKNLPAELYRRLK